MNYRKTIAVLLLLSLVYGGWYAWQSRPTPPLQARVLPIELADVQRALIEVTDQPPVELSREADDWIVQGGNRYVIAQKNQVEGMINRLIRARSNGLVKPGKKQRQVLASITLITANGNQLIEFIATPDSVKNTSYLRLNNVPDIYQVGGFTAADFPLKFTDYQNKFLLDISDFSGIDSLVWVTDSLRTNLLVRSINSVSLDSLYNHWQQLRGDAFADNFDEIGMRDFKLGDYLIYGNSSADSTRLTVYHDSLREPPYVLRSEQFPEGFWLADSLPYSHDLIIRKKVLK